MIDRCAISGADNNVQSHHIAGRQNNDTATVPLRKDLHRPSLSTSGETLTIEESMTLRARTENAGHVGVEHEWREGGG